MYKNKFPQFYNFFTFVETMEFGFLTHMKDLLYSTVYSLLKDDLQKNKE